MLPIQFIRYCQVAFQSVNAPAAYKDSCFPTCSQTLGIDKCFNIFLVEEVKTIPYNYFMYISHYLLLVISVSSTESPQLCILSTFLLQVVGESLFLIVCKSSLNTIPLLYRLKIFTPNL